MTRDMDFSVASLVLRSLSEIGLADLEALVAVPR